MMLGVMHKRAIAALVFALFLGPMTVAVTISTALRYRAPDAALAIWPWNAEAWASLANRRMLAGDFKAARDAARRAVSTAPGNAVALRTLGVSTEALGDPPRGLRFMNLATRASRRDLPTNLWFIEHNVGRGDISGAIQYYDFSLKSSAPAEQLLFPILVPAMRDSRIAAAVMNKLKGRPVWTTSFLQYAFSSGAADNKLVPMTLLLSMDKTGLSQDLKQQYAQRLAERGNFVGLETLAAGLGHPLIAGPTDLSNVGNLPPVDWRLLSAEGAAIFPEPGKGFSYIVADGDATLAERIFRLPPGVYTLRLTTDPPTEASDTHLRWAMMCASDGRLIAIEPNGHDARFVIPSIGCANQKLSLLLDSERLNDSGDISGAVTSIHLNRMR